VIGIVEGAFCFLFFVCVFFCYTYCTVGLYSKYRYTTGTLNSYSYVHTFKEFGFILQGYYVDPGSSDEPK